MSTQRALASELGLATQQAKRQRVAARVTLSTASSSTHVRRLGMVTLKAAEPAALSMEVEGDKGSRASSSRAEAEGLTGQAVVAFLEGDVGQSIFQWWIQGLVPSLSIQRELGTEILEAFQAQRIFMQNSEV